MKKFLALIVAIILSLPITTFSANAIQINYCAFFEEQINFIPGLYNEPYEILEYTFFRALDKSEYLIKSEILSNNTIKYYSIPGDVFEATAKLHFNFDITEFRNEFSAYYYDANTQTYNFNDNDFGRGGGVHKNVFGYKQNGNTYTIYVIETEHYDLDENDMPIIPEGAVENIDYIFNGYEYAPIEGFAEATVTYDGTNIKFLTYKKIEKLPNKNLLITPDTKVESPTGNTSSNVQSSSSAISSSSNNKNSSNTQTTPSSIKADTSTQITTNDQSSLSSYNNASNTPNTSSTETITSSQANNSSTQSYNANQSSASSHNNASNIPNTSSTETTISSQTNNSSTQNDNANQSSVSSKNDSSISKITSSLDNQTASSKTNSKISSNTTSETSNVKDEKDNNSTQNSTEKIQKLDNNKSKNTNLTIIITVTALIIFLSGSIILFLLLKKKSNNS